MVSLDIRYTAKCKDCLFYNNIGRGKRSFCKLKGVPTRGKDLVCHDWQLIGCEQQLKELSI